MKKYIHRFLGVGFLTIICVTVAIFTVFQYLNTYLNQEIERNLKLKNDSIAEGIHAELQRQAQIVEHVAIYINLYGTQEQQVLTYLAAILEETEHLESIYYGTTENQMINASGWVPPDTFDLRTRPWYIQAQAQQTIVFTDVFLNASGDKQIITVAKPIYDDNQDLLGVVGADISIEKIVSLIENQTSESSYAFLLNREQEVLAYSSNFINRPEPSIEGADVFLTTLEGHLGYVLLKPITYTELTLGTFVLEKTYIGYQQQLLMVLIFSLTVVIILFVWMFLTQRRILLKPLMVLDSDITEISSEKDLSYRLPVKEKDSFQLIRQSVNRVLNDTEQFFNALTYNQEELEAANEELMATLGQLQAYEAELNNQYDRLKDSNSRLKESEARNLAILSVLPDMLFVYDAIGTYIDCQTNDDSNLVLPKEAMLGKNISDVLPEDLTKRIKDAIKATLKTGEIKHLEYGLPIQNKTKYFEMRMVKSLDDQVLAIVRDVTLEKREQDYILELSYTDHLTNLYNRRYFEETLEVMDHARYLPLAIMMIDVNGLKLTNDAFGHYAGDALLKQVAAILESNSLEKGFVARVGGDEFVMVCPEVNHEIMERLVGNIYRDLDAVKMKHIVISISAGWHIRVSMDQSIRDIFIKAENHMFRRKIVESQSMRNQTIQVIMKTLNEKNEREKRHSDQVSSWSRSIGEAMGLNAQLLNEIQTAGLVHDIGKIAIRDEVLDKPGRLTEEEYDEIKKHSESGYQILKSVDAYSSLADDVLSHHERYDGKGYPRGLKGNQIPLIARIIGVADAYEAMISDRSYRKGMPHAEALEEIKRCSGTQFDPEITKAFMRLFE